MNGSADLFVCPLCGHRFQEGVQACGACPLSRGCDTSCCPHCGYRLAPRSKIAAALRRWLEPFLGKESGS